MKYRNGRAIFKYSFFLLIISLLLVLNIFFLDRINYVCPFRKLFHIYCPGCGGTRMIKALFKMDFYQSFRYNPLLFIFLVIGIIYLGVMMIVYIKKRKLILPSVRVYVFMLVLLVIYMVLRNIPAFSYLIPTKV